MKRVKTISVSEFKAKALALLEEVRRSRETIVIVKRGAPLAQVQPIASSQKQRPGKLIGTVVQEEDIVSPLGADLWNATK